VASNPPLADAATHYTPQDFLSHTLSVDADSVHIVEYVYWCGLADVFQPNAMALSSLPIIP